MNPSSRADFPPHKQVDGDSVMDVEIASITQLTNSVQLAEPPKSHSPGSQLESDFDAGMDLDGDNDPSRHSSSTHSSGVDVLLGGIPKWGQDEAVGAHTQTGNSWSLEHEALATSDEVVFASHMTELPTTLVSDTRDVLHAIFESVEGHEDDADSEWLDSASVRADTQSVIAGDSEDELEYDGETGEDDDEMLSGDEAVLAGVPHVVKAWD